jgi:hypothetical protein
MVSSRPRCSADCRVRRAGSKCLFRRASDRHGVVKRYSAARGRRAHARARKDDAAARAAQDELEALVLFKSAMDAFLRLYTFLSQIFGYGNTDTEKCAIFYRSSFRC